MSTETIDPRYSELDTWTLERSLDELIDSNRRAVEAVAAALPQLRDAAEGVAERLVRGGRLVYLGAGTSGRLALQDAAELPPTFGFDRTVVLLAGGSEAGERAREGAEDDEEDAERRIDEAGVGPDDAVIGIAASGRTPFTVAGVRSARARGALTVGMANNPGSPLLEVAERPVLLASGPEVLAGSTRLAAGTAQKVALNALSTAVLVRLGGAYRNLMVGMTPVNEKLRRRAVAIVAEATGAETSVAADALEEAGGAIREAIVALAAGVSAERARELVERHDGHVRAALREALEER